MLARHSPNSGGEAYVVPDFDRTYVEARRPGCGSPAGPVREHCSRFGVQIRPDWTGVDATDSDNRRSRETSQYPDCGQENQYVGRSTTPLSMKQLDRSVGGWPPSRPPSDLLITLTAAAAGHS